MKKIIFLFLILTCLSSNSLTKDSNIYIYQYDKVAGKFTYEQFNALINGADNYQQIIDAQNNNRVTIICNDIKPTSKQGEYKTTLKIIWKDKEGKELNYIVSELTLNIDNDKSGGISTWRIKYRDIAETGFPICAILIIIIVVLL